MFSYFIEQRIKESPYENYFKFFDSCFTKKKTKKEPNFFMEEKNIQVISCPLPNDAISNKN